MSDYRRCQICGDFGWFDSIFAAHKCKPSWDVYVEDWHGDREDCAKVNALTAEEAVERWAEVSDSDGDYTIVNGSPATVEARKSGTDNPWVTYVVEGEAVPSYHAREKSDV